MPSPKVWSRFTVKKCNGTVLNLRIQNLPSDRLKDVQEFNEKYFSPDENFQRAAGINKSPESMEEGRLIIREMMQDPNYHISVCCLDNDDNVLGDIIGVSSIVLSKKDDPDELKELQEKVQSKEILKLLEIVNGMSVMFDVKSKFDVLKYYDGRGVAVHHEYRGMGIAKELLRVRRMICKEHGVPLTIAWMTSIGTQKAAERDGWQTAYEVTFEELAQKFGVTFENAPPLCKSMYAEIK